MDFFVFYFKYGKEKVVIQSVIRFTSQILSVCHPYDTPDEYDETHLCLPNNITLKPTQRWSPLMPDKSTGIRQCLILVCFSPAFLSCFLLLLYSSLSLSLSEAFMRKPLSCEVNFSPHHPSLSPALSVSDRLPERQ